MRVAVIGRPNVQSSYQAKWNCLPDRIELTLISPPAIKQTLQVYAAEKSKRWPHLFVPAWMTDRLSPFGFEPASLWNALRRVKPQLVHVDEEPPSLAMFELTLLKRLLNFKLVFVTWENLVTSFLPPFNLVRRLTFKLADAGIAGNAEAARLMREAGFSKPIAVIPLTATDAALFSPRRADDLRQSLGLTEFTVGYVGRLVPEKGIDSLLSALASLGGAWQGLIIGRGPQRAQLIDQARQLGIADRLIWMDTRPHQEMPHYFNTMDVLALPSRTASRWAEQFGRVLAEAMACQVPVIGSNSGAIPEVIGDAGLVFPEGNATVLTQHLDHLRKEAGFRQALGRRGRERVLALYTNQRIAERTAAFWREIASTN